MIRITSTGRSWPIRGAVDLVGAARRAEALARELGWPPKDAEALSRMVVELGGNALQRTGGGTCQVEAAATSAEVIVEDLAGESTRARLSITVAPAPANPFAATG